MSTDHAIRITDQLDMNFYTMGMLHTLFSKQNIILGPTDGTVSTRKFRISPPPLPCTYAIIIIFLVNSVYCKTNI